MILVNGNRWCSGSLVNTTAGNLYPYFLTADHCLGGWVNDFVKYDAITHNSPNLTWWSFYWHYESPGCTDAAPDIKSTSGAILVANNPLSDFALLKLTEDPRNKDGVTPYYLGWDRSGNAVTSGVVIHHPNGDIKKISITSQIIHHPLSICWGGTGCPQGTSLADTHWDVYFAKKADGTTEGGSSGSPLIDNNHRVIGQLHGGSPGCAPITRYFGKFNVSWTGSLTSTPDPDGRRRLDCWLAPGLSNPPQTIDGITSIKGPKSICLTGSYSTSTGQSAQWVVSSGFRVSPSTGNSTTVMAAAPHQYDGLLSAEINGLITYKHITTCAVGIYGPGSICNSGIYSSSNGQSTTWSVISGFSVSPTTGSSVTVTALSPGKSGTLSAILNGSTVTFGIESCGTPLSIVGPDVVSTTAKYTLNNGQAVTWDVVPPVYFSITPVNGGISAIVTKVTSSTSCSGAVLAKINSTTVATKPISCGGKGGAGSSYIFVYPNPVDNILTIEIDADTAQSLLPIQAKLTFDVRLYDGQGNLLRQARTQGGTVQFDISNIPDGIYYLHVYDDAGSNPIIETIIVEH